jgi:SpoVK/Ycf46/Vps4 family AAA+-type ATPase
LLFLTTNRQATLDEAFNNRIHVKIKFYPLDFEARFNIWRNLLTKKKDRILLDNSWGEEEEEIRTLARLEMNGRDIRNLIRTAYGFARSKGRELGVRHVVTVMREIVTAPNVEEIAKVLQPVVRRSMTVPPPSAPGT